MIGAFLALFVAVNMLCAAVAFEIAVCILIQTLFNDQWYVAGWLTISALGVLHAIVATALMGLEIKREQAQLAKGKTHP